MAFASVASLAASLVIALLALQRAESWRSAAGAPAGNLVNDELPAVAHPSAAATAFERSVMPTPLESGSAAAPAVSELRAEPRAAEPQELRFLLVDDAMKPVSGTEVWLCPMHADPATGVSSDIDWDARVERTSGHDGMVSFARREEPYELLLPWQGEDSRCSWKLSLSHGTHRIQLPGGLLWTADVMAAERRLEIRVRTCDGALAAGATVMLHRSEAHLGTACTDERGVARFPPQEGPCTVRIDAPPAALYSRYLAEIEGTCEIALPRGEVVQGRFAWSGEPSEGRAEVELLREGGRHRALVARARELSVALADPFRFTGLEATWSGRLCVELPPTWQATTVESGVRANARFSTRRSRSPLQLHPGEPVVIELDAPAEDLVIHVKRARVLHARLVRTETGTAIAAGRVELYADPERPRDVSSASAADDQGRVAVPFGDGIARLVVRVGMPEDVGTDEVALRRERRLEVDVPAEDDLDLGDIALAPERVLSFRMIDEGGQPIERGIAGCRTKHAMAFSEPTDVHGVSEIALLHDAREVHFAALEKQIAAVPIPSADQEPLVVLLQPGCRIDIRVLDAQGRPAAWSTRADVHLRLHSDEDPLGSTDRELDAELFDRIGATSMYYCSHDRAAWLRDGRDPMPVSGLRGGLAYRLHFATDDPASTPQEHVLSLANGEAREVIFRLSESEPKKREGFCGVVLDPDGKPLESVHYDLECARGSSSSGTWRSPGHDHAFCIEGEISEPMRLCLTHEAYAPLLVEDLRLEEGARVATFRFERGRAVTFKLRDRDGRAVLDAQPHVEIPVRGSPSPAWMKPQVAANGDYRFEHLPAGELRFVAEIAEKTYELRHDTTRPEAVLEIPVHSALCVSLGAPITWPGRYAIALAPFDAGCRELSTSFVVSASGDPARFAEHRFPHVLPGRYRVEFRDANPESARAPTFRGFAPREVVVTNEAQTVVLAPL